MCSVICGTTIVMSFTNDHLLTIASKLLGGRDPVEFICWLCDESLDNPAIKNLK